MIRDLPDRSFWSLAGIGDSQLSINSVAIAIGGGVRVGLEDNIFYDTGRTTLARNIALLSRIHRIADAHERPIMPAQELRRLLELEDGNAQYGRKNKDLVSDVGPTRGKPELRVQTMMVKKLASHRHLH